MYFLSVLYLHVDSKNILMKKEQEFCLGYNEDDIDMNEEVN